MHQLVFFTFLLFFLSVNTKVTHSEPISKVCDHKAVKCVCVCTTSCILWRAKKPFVKIYAWQKCTQKHELNKLLINPNKVLQLWVAEIGGKYKPLTSSRFHWLGLFTETLGTVIKQGKSLRRADVCYMATKKNACKFSFLMEEKVTISGV